MLNLPSTSNYPFGASYYSLEKGNLVEGTVGVHCHLSLFFEGDFDWDEALKKAQQKRIDNDQVQITRVEAFLKSLVCYQLGIRGEEIHKKNLTHQQVKDRSSSLLSYILKPSILKVGDVFGKYNEDNSTEYEYDPDVMQRLVLADIKGRTFDWNINDYANTMQKFLNDANKHHKITSDKKDFIFTVIQEAKQKGYKLNYVSLVDRGVVDKVSISAEMHKLYTVHLRDLPLQVIYTPMGIVQGFVDNNSVETLGMDSDKPYVDQMRKVFTRRLQKDYREVTKWIKNHFLKTQHFRKMLMFRGPSGSGKTSFIKNFFPDYLFDGVVLGVGTKFQDSRAYDPKTLLWYFPELNTDLTTNNIMKIQNTINGDIVLDRKHKEIDSSQSPRPIIAGTTVDIEYKLKEYQDQIGSQQIEVVKQFLRRLIIIDIKDDEKEIDKFQWFTWKWQQSLSTKKLGTYIFWETILKLLPEIEDEIVVPTLSPELFMPLSESDCKEEDLVLKKKELPDEKQEDQERVIESNSELITENGTFDKFFNIRPGMK